MKLRQLAVPYQRYEIKLEKVGNDLRRPTGVGVRVKLNTRTSLLLLLDTGASGISITPKTAERAGLEQLTTESTEASGFGDDQAQDSMRQLAKQVSFGSLSFTDYPISVFRSARTGVCDGLIGADVFRSFFLTIDFTRPVLTLEPFPQPRDESAEDLDDAGVLPAGFSRAFRFGNHLAVMTAVNEQSERLFLLDSGSSQNLIDTALAAESTKVRGDSNTRLQGVQGTVKTVARADQVKLRFAGFLQHNPDLLAVSLDKMSDSFGVGFGGVLGWNVLFQLKLTIDYRNGAIRLSR